MATPSAQLIFALRATALRLESGHYYQWTHQGNCNCGHLVQTLTAHRPDEIHQFGLQKSGDWSEHANDYCSRSGYAIDQIISYLLSLGFTTHDLVHLERLSDRAVLRAIPAERRNALRFNRKDDVALYLRTWANLLASAHEDLIGPLPDLEANTAVASDFTFDFRIDPTQPVVRTRPEPVLV